MRVSKHQWIVFSPLQISVCWQDQVNFKGRNSLWIDISEIMKTRMNLTVFTHFISEWPGSSKYRNETEMSKGPLQSLSGSYSICLYKWPLPVKQTESSSKLLSFLQRQKWGGICLLGFSWLQMHQPARPYHTGNLPVARGIVLSIFIAVHVI